MLLEMLQDREADRFAETNRDGVADHLSDLGENHGLVPRNEFIIFREGLQQSPFAKTDRPILLGMAEAPVTVAEKLRSDGRSRSFPLHAPIDAWVISTHFGAVAFSHEFIGPVSPTAAGFGVADALMIDRRQAAGTVKAVIGGFSRFQLRQVGDGLTDIRRTGQVAGFVQIDFPEPRGEQNQTPTLLGDAVVWAIRLLVGNAIPAFLKSVDEVPQNSVSLQFRDVLHADDFGKDYFYQSSELMKQPPLGVFPSVLTLSVFGKWLTGRAADQNAGAGCPEHASEFIGLDIRDAFVDETRSLIVVLVGEAAGTVDVVASRNRDARVDETPRQTARTAEEIDGENVFGTGDFRWLGHTLMATWWL